MSNSIKDLECCALFNGLNREGLVNLFEFVEAQTFTAGSVILDQGLTHRTLWVVIRGNCEVVRLCGNQDDQQLAVLQPGGIFGEMSFFQEAPHSATVRALNDVEVLLITPDAFQDLQSLDLQAAFVITSNLVRLLSDRLRRMDNWTCELIDNSENGRQHAEWQEFQSKLYADWSF